MTEQEFSEIKRANGGKFFVPKWTTPPQCEPKLTITKRITATIQECRKLWFNDYPKGAA